MSKDDDFKLKVKSSYYFFTKKDYKRSLEKLEKAAKMIAKEIVAGQHLKSKDVIKENNLNDKGRHKIVN